MTIKSYLYKHRPEFAIASEYYGAYRDFRKAGFKKTPYGFMMAGPASMQDGSYEYDETRDIINLIKEADVFIDVGANVGYYSCVARSFGKKVLTIEPLWQNTQYIYHNLSCNGWFDVEVYPVGLSDKPGLSVLYGVGTEASLIKNWAGLSTKKRMVPLSTMDILVANRFSGQKLVIKIDVEGTEYQVLKGSYETLHRTPAPLWIIEIGLTGYDPKGHNDKFLQTFEMFWDMNYHSYHLGVQLNEKITPHHVLNWINNMSTEGHDNFLFKKDNDP